MAYANSTYIYLTMPSPKSIKKRIKLEKNPINELIANMYDKLAAKMVVALYKEKRKIISQLKGKL